MSKMGRNSVITRLRIKAFCCYFVHVFPFDNPLWICLLFFFDREENTVHNVIQRWKEKQCVSEMLSHKIFKSFIEHSLYVEHSVRRYLG